MSLQQMLDIAMRYRTAMADAMVVACFQAAHELGVTLRATARPSLVPSRGERPTEDVDWRRMVEGNREVRA